MRGILKNMVRRTTLPQLMKYDVSQRILEALADAEARAILFSTISEDRNAAELSEMHNIPLSSVYKKLALLENLALVEVSSTSMSYSRKRIKMYRSRISQAEIDIKKPYLDPGSLKLVPN